MMIIQPAKPIDSVRQRLPSPLRDVYMKRSEEIVKQGSAIRHRPRPAFSLQLRVESMPEAQWVTPPETVALPNLVA